MNDKKLLAYSITNLTKYEENKIKKETHYIVNPRIFISMTSITDEGRGPDRVYIKESAIHGLGVFAKKDIKRGKIITYYPAHYVITFPQGRQIGAAERDIYPIPGKIAKERGLEFEKNMMRYSVDVNSYYSICGDHRIQDNPGFLGHLINDAAIGHSTLHKRDKKDEEIYYVVVAHRMNGIIQGENGSPLFMIIKATRDIKKDEEILTGYGYNYWCEINSARENKQMGL